MCWLDLDNTGRLVHGMTASMALLAPLEWSNASRQEIEIIHGLFWKTK